MFFFALIFWNGPYFSQSNLPKITKAFVSACTIFTILQFYLKDSASKSTKWSNFHGQYFMRWLVRHLYLFKAEFLSGVEMSDLWATIILSAWNPVITFRILHWTKGKREIKKNTFRINQELLTWTQSAALPSGTVVKMTKRLRYLQTQNKTNTTQQNYLRYLNFPQVCSLC